jgi:predicted aspartyl protease
MLRVSLALAALLGSIAAAHAATVVPTVYEAGHFFATPTTKDGQSLRILIDTGAGGDNYWITRDAATRLKLKPSACAKDPQEAEAKVAFVARPGYAPHKAMPTAKAHCGDVMVLDKGPDIGGAEGIAGGNYLATRVWTFDYPARQLRVEDDAWHPAPGAHAIDLGMQRGDDGSLTTAYPRVTIGVAGEAIDVLLDTGATAQPTKAGLAAMKTPVVNAQGVASYITTSIMNRWHADHPDWPLLEGADQAGIGRAARAIQVPSLEIGGWSVGPVWFTERADRNFDPFMSQYMDRTIHGAVGANVLDAFVMTLDYRKAKAWLGCPEACRAKPAAATVVKH